MSNTLTDREKRTLRFRGYTNADIDPLTDEQAHELLANRRNKPGSTRAAKAAAAVASAAGMPGLPAAAHAVDPTRSTAHVITDEYTHRLAGGSNMNEEIAAPYHRDNPDKAFRILTPNTIKHRGMRGWQPVYDSQGKKVTVLNENRPLCWKPKDVRDANLEGYREQHASLRAAAADRMRETAAKAERDTGGAIRMLRDGQVIGGVPIGDSSNKGYRVTE